MCSVLQLAMVDVVGDGVTIKDFSTFRHIMLLINAVTAPRLPKTALRVRVSRDRSSCYCQLYNCSCNSESEENDQLSILHVVEVPYPKS